MASSRNHEVFLSFRGEDTRNNFLSHLKAYLAENGVATFTDDEQIRSGEYISPQLIQAIEDSRCSIVIISPNYASSTWCLAELVKILDCKERNGQIVIPIFYHVDRFDVENQCGGFGEALAKHDGDSQIQSWRNALTQLAHIPGFDFQDGDEAELIGKIAAAVSSKLMSNSTTASFNFNNIYRDIFGINSTRLNSYYVSALRGPTHFFCCCFFFKTFCLHLYSLI
ncbi:toll/interleukin-1 receptor-like protein [Humulus lupulus]|uniref:toll/interleukin-1 receptor-like protein n=1 Tax=Humulus lupulus TaxID=3486 RepID=UPI002B40CBE3|nr:toll/interleukin-1 receptor-like protein [Humulus lupulus]